MNTYSSFFIFSLLLIFNIGFVDNVKAAENLTLDLANDSELSSESQTLLADLEKQIRGTILAIKEAETRAGNTQTPIHIALSVPSQQKTNLGLILDFDNLAVDGAKVVSVTPGSQAESLGIRPGDKLTAFNQVRLSDNNSDRIIEDFQNLIPGDSVSLELKQKQSNRKLEFRIAGLSLPGFNLEVGESSQIDSDVDSSGTSPQACGRVSIFFRPPETKDLYPVLINSIDDDYIHRFRETIRLPVGKHKIKVHELITDPFLQRHRRTSSKAKVIEIDVKANTTYHLAAKFDRSKRMKVFRNEYWQPEVWRRTEKSCEF
ncbi:PDZ domain-containing protein [Aliikangiella sp. G2MR2-5]|uniref:PDZ domain-containing protein n=1 Tax=Aliikangiella sp. G2MR2-5 TaxID=2788943 RepID=UPI0018AAC508|nr:PDZ domain-containing protein [Aliikangiella sp. G2MR2-5]